MLRDEDTRQRDSRPEVAGSKNREVHTCDVLKGAECRLHGGRLRAVQQWTRERVEGRVEREAREFAVTDVREARTRHPLDAEHWRCTRHLSIHVK